MDKNSIFGIVIIIGILIIYGIINKPSQQELERKQQLMDSLNQVRQEQQLIEKTIAQEAAEKQLTTQAKIGDTIDIEKLSATLGDFSSAGNGQVRFYTLENDLLRITFSNKGGRPYTVELKDYKTHNNQPLILFTGDSTVFGLEFMYQNRYIATNNLFFKAIRVDTLSDGKSTPVSAVFRLEAGEGRYIDYTYTLKPEDYMVSFDLRVEGLGDISTRKPETIDLTWEIFAPSHEKGWQNESQYTTLYYKPFQDKVENFSPRSNKEFQEQDIPTRVEWVAFKNQFFSSVILADKAFDNARIRTQKMAEGSPYLRHFKAEIGLAYAPGSYESAVFTFYFGPNKFKLLRQYKETDLHELVTLGKGIIKWINQYVIIVIFDWLSRFIANYGIIILLLTIIIKIGLIPLTYKSYLSMAKMRVLKPQIDELSKKYPKGKELEKQQASMALYKKAGASPLGGCLPQVLQFPILFAMFRFFPTSIELRQQSFLWAKDLSTYDSILELPFKIPFGYGDHVSLFTILMTVSTILTIKMSSQATSTGPQMPGMKTMMYIMPVMFMFFLNSFSAALTYYYFLANVITFGQNWLFKQFIDEEELLKKMEMRKARPQKKSNFQARIEDMAKKRGYAPPKKKK